MSAERFQLPYGELAIEFHLQRRDRKTMAISVLPDLTVEVIAPSDASLDRIFERITKRAPWITRQLLFFEQFHPRTPERRFVAGETHLYLGRQYKLKVVAHIQQRVKLYRGQLVVQTHRPERGDVTRTLVQDWFRERARMKFKERLSVCQSRFADPDAFAPSMLILRQLRQRWGSMTPSGRLILNPSLIRASVDAIDYVLTHELCHLEHPHHGLEFYQLLGRVMPDWEKRKAKLERQTA